MGRKSEPLTEREEQKFLKKLFLSKIKSCALLKLLKCASGGVSREFAGLKCKYS
ncbi:hypothetical protein BC643_0971 [Mangrovibacterium diazotrophicum]|uniref:Uncharacterized protein n=1 Tax=Mangrovibacterium diazotrophicum TaxID=1261403 RepID=A0A419W5D0_9BACT|nr:hypothetical protein BC643_0971 [Mangrovibacterium diazotrophicum]